MTSSVTDLDFDHLLKLRLVVARFGEMDAAMWWSTGDASRKTAVLGRAGALLMSRGFPRTQLFAQARLVFTVARARCREVFDPPGSITLWDLPPHVEDQFDARWAHWLEERGDWQDFFSALEATPTDLVEMLTERELVGSADLERVTQLRRSAEGRAVPLPGIHTMSNGLVTQLAAAFSRGELGKLAVPYARLDV